MSNQRVGFSGRWFGIFNGEGDDYTPIALYPDEPEARAALERRQALHVDSPQWLSPYYQVFHVDLVGAWWNSYDPDPRLDAPLSMNEIVAVAGDTDP